MQPPPYQNPGPPPRPRVPPHVAHGPAPRPPKRGMGLGWWLLIGLGGLGGVCLLGGLATALAPPEVRARMAAEEAVREGGRERAEGRDAQARREAAAGEEKRDAFNMARMWAKEKVPNENVELSTDWRTARIEALGGGRYRVRGKATMDDHFAPVSTLGYDATVQKGREDNWRLLKLAWD